MKQFHTPQGFSGMIRKDFEYYCGQGKILYALSKVRDRRDIVKLVKEYGLTSSFVKKCCKLNEGRDVIYNILEHAGVAWTSTYFAGLTMEQLNDLPIPKQYINYFLKNSWSDASPNHDWYVVSMMHQDMGNLHGGLISFYMYLVVYGISCDTEMIQRYIATSSPEHFLRDDIRMICNTFISKYGTDDPISLLLQQAINKKRKIVMEQGRIHQYVNQLGGVYTFHYPSSTVTYDGRQWEQFKTNSSDTVVFTEVGTYVNDYLFPHRELEALYSRDGMSSFSIINGIIEFNPPLTTKMRSNASAPFIHGIDLYHMTHDIQELGYDNDLVSSIASYEQWGDDAIVFYADGYIDGDDSDQVNAAQQSHSIIIRKGVRHIAYCYNMSDNDYFLNFEHVRFHSPSDIFLFTVDDTEMELHSDGLFVLRNDVTDTLAFNYLDV